MLARCVRISAGGLAIALFASACGADAPRFFDVDLRTVRRCHPGGIVPQTCDDPSSFARQSANTRVAIELLGPDQIVFFDSDGRALPGNLEREESLVWNPDSAEPALRRRHFFARQRSATVAPSGCEKLSSRSVRLVLDEDLLPAPPGKSMRPARLSGTLQERSEQSATCGQATAAKAEESFAGTEVAP